MIEFNRQNKAFILKTNETCYVFKIVYDRYLMHVYYGAIGGDIDFGYMPPKVSYITNPKDFFGMDFSLETLSAEYAYYGTGDFRTSSICIRTASGDANVMFYYIGHEIYGGAEVIDGLPSSRADEPCETLRIELFDPVCSCRLFLYYKVFEKSNVIARFAKVVNESRTTVEIEKCMSMCFDAIGHDFDLVTLCGCYGNEMNLCRKSVSYGNQSVSSRRGATGHNNNPFLAVCDRRSTYTEGFVYGFNLVYSGNFLSEAELMAYSLADFQSYDLLRVQLGINSENFCYSLRAGESFSSPEAIMTFSDRGLNGMTQNFHAFIRRNLLPKDCSQRPIVLNTWESCLFDIDREKLVRFAKECKKVGIDTLVIDDGWFGKRNDDTSSLGDWTVDFSKFGNGLKGFADEIKAYVKFGIWIEPEMISEDSALYRAHPEWVLGRAERPLSYGRNQYVLDFTNPHVIAYLKESFLETFRGIDISYIKWDMNRSLTEVGTRTSPDASVGETAYRYLRAVYELLSWFHKVFPQAVFETCSGGGGRYDLGMASFSSMIWTSDNTNPEYRIGIQTGALTAYPACMMSCHVSAPKGRVLDKSELNERFVVAAQGMLGYELDICALSKELKDDLSELTERYRLFRHVIEDGDYAVISAPNRNKNSIYYYFTQDEILLGVLWDSDEHPPAVTIFNADELCEYKEVFTNETVSGKDLKTGAFFTFKKGKIAEIKYFQKKKETDIL